MSRVPVLMFKVGVIMLLLVVNISLYSNYSNPDAVPRPSSSGDLPTPTSIPEETESNHMENVIQARFDARSARVRTVCETPGHEAAAVRKPHDLVAVPILGLAWCPTFKAGSSNWLDLICKETFNHEAYKQCNMHRLRASNPASRFLAKQGEFMWDAGMVKELGLPFMVVRNPVNRFLSAFRDKIELGNVAWYYDNLGEKIVSTYRDVRVPETEKTALLALARKVIMDGGGGVEKWDSSNPYLSPPGPTFLEFVKWAIEDGVDPHLITIHKQCGPCVVDYTILRLEKLSEEADYLFQKVERSYLNLDFQTSLNVNGKTSDCVDEFYSTLPGELLNRIYNKFMRVDCELYAYPCEERIERIMDLPRSSPSLTHLCK